MAMTDNEIIKALECCESGYGNCNSYPYDAESCITTEGESLLLKSALNLINRQQAEIERLQKNIDGLNIFTKNHINVIRLQAIKEFAERLKRKRIALTCEEPVYDLFKVGTIDNLVKEMTEENKNDRA